MQGQKYKIPINSLMKNILVVTGGAGFIGSNLIEELIKFRKYKIISLDNYSSGNKKNHIKNLRRIYKAWQRPTLPCLKTKYHWR